MKATEEETQQPAVIFEGIVDLGDLVEKETEIAASTEGGFADVWRGQLWADRFRSRQLAQVAVKQLRLSVTPDEKILKRITSEVRIWSRLRHENVQVFLGISTQWGLKRVCMVSPWRSNGNSMDYLRLNFTDDSAGYARVFKLICGIANGLAYLHGQENPVVHGDVKGQNVLVSDDGAALLTDFGLSCLVEDVDAASGVSSITQAGSRNWMAPERIAPEQYGLTSSNSRTPASDMFSFGMTLYEILSDTLPYAHLLNAFAVMTAIVTKGDRPPLPDGVHSRFLRANVEITQLVRPWMLRCYASQPAERPTAAEVYASLSTSSAAHPSLWGVIADHVRASKQTATNGSSDSSVGWPNTIPRSMQIPVTGELDHELSRSPEYHFPTSPTHHSYSQASQWSQDEDEAAFHTAPSTQVQESQLENGSQYEVYLQLIPESQFAASQGSQWAQYDD